MEEALIVPHRVDTVIQQMSSLFNDVDAYATEEEYLMQERDYLLDEVRRFQDILRQAEHDLAAMTASTEALALKRDEALRAQPPESLYVEVGQLTEQNTLMKLDIEYKELLLDATMRAAQSLMEQTSTLERDHADLRGYITRLTEVTEEQALEVDKRQSAQDQIQAADSHIIEQEREIAALKQALGRLDVAVPTAPTTCRAARQAKFRGAILQPSAHGDTPANPAAGEAQEGETALPATDSPLLLSTSTIVTPATAATAALNSPQGKSSSSNKVVFSRAASLSVSRRIVLTVGVLRLLNEQFGMSIRAQASLLGVTGTTISTDNVETVIVVNGPITAVDKFELKVVEALRDAQAQDGLHTYKSNDRAVCYDVAFGKLKGLLEQQEPTTLISIAAPPV